MPILANQISLTNQIADDTENIALFRGLSPADVTRLREHLGRKIFRSGSLVLALGQHNPAVYFVVRGTLRISTERAGNQVTVNVVGPGDMLGEISVLDNLGHSADVTALEEADLLWMERDVFDAHLRSVPMLAYNLALGLSRRVRLSTSRVEMLATLDVSGRIAHQLLAFAREYGEPAEDGSIRIPLRLTQSELAELVGATREWINQSLRDFKQLGLISIAKDHHITVHDAEELAKRCT
jgi:CRP/FNR family cyclic AMP-dependent transcriptional regulator